MIKEIRLLPIGDVSLQLLQKFWYSTKRLNCTLNNQFFGNVNNLSLTDSGIELSSVEASYPSLILFYIQYVSHACCYDMSTDTGYTTSQCVTF